MLPEPVTTEPESNKPQIADDDRSCYGLGWEYCRRGWDIQFNPFTEGSPRWAWFNQGWQAKEKLDLSRPKTRRNAVADNDNQSGGYDNEGRGALFVNKNKKTDKHPDRVGDAQLDGRKIRIFGWLKTSKYDKPYLSLSVKWDDQQDQPPRQQAAQQPASEDIPF